MGFLDLPDRPDEPGRPERGSASNADRPTPKPSELPDPDERGRVYEAMRAYGFAGTAPESSDAAGEAQHGKQADGARQRAYRRAAPLHGHVGRPPESWPEARRHAADVTTANHKTTARGQARSGRRKRPRRWAGFARPTETLRRRASHRTGE